MRMPAWLKGSLVLAVTLCAGVVIGVSYERWHTAHRPIRGLGPAHLINRLQHQLDLDSAQRAKISAILARHQAEVDSTWRVLQPHVRANIQSSLREITTVLRPDQAAKYRDIVEAMHPGTLP
jgi:hypothetical protein